MSFHKESLWGTTLMPLRLFAIDWGRNRILGVSENSGPVLSRLWSKVHEILGRCKGPLVFSNAVGDCLCRVSFRRYSPLSLEIVEKPRNVKVFGLIFFGRATTTFLRQIVSAIYCPPFGKVWQTFVCWSPCAKAGNEVECGIYGGWVKCRSNFEPFVDQSLWHFEMT